VKKQDVARSTRWRSLSASLTIVMAALIMVAVGMHSLVQAQRLAGAREDGTRLADQIDPTTYLTIITPTLSITLTAHPSQIHVSGEKSILEAQVTDPFFSPVPDGTEVSFETSLGTLGGLVVTRTTVAGVASATLSSGPSAGSALITATAGGAKAYTTVEFIWYEILLPLIARND
jgi:hypothetical protein